MDAIEPPKLYHIQYDGQSYFVEAPNLGRAVEAWRVHVLRQHEERMPVSQP